MTTCPYCRNKAVSLIRKCFVGWGWGPAECISCGRRVSIPFSATLGVTPFLFSIFLADCLAVHSWYYSAISFLSGLTAMAAIHAFLVPLVPNGA